MVGLVIPKDFNKLWFPPENLLKGMVLRNLNMKDSFKKLILRFGYFIHINTTKKKMLNQNKSINHEVSFLIHFSYIQ